MEFFFHNYNKSLVVKLKVKETFSISPIVHSLSGGKYKNLLVNGKSLILFSPNCIQCNARRMSSNGLPFIGEKFCMDFEFWLLVLCFNNLLELIRICKLIMICMECKAMFGLTKLERKEIKSKNRIKKWWKNRFKINKLLFLYYFKLILLVITFLYKD